MNLTEFINYRATCPICETALVTGFVSERRQIVRHEEGRFNVQFPLDSLNVGEKDYRCTYSFGMNDQSFSTEFFTKEGVQFDKAIPIFLTKRFKQLHQNLKIYKFFRGCSLCRKYAYGSQNFEIDFHQATFGDLNIWSEKALISSPLEDGYRVYSLTNFIVEKRSEVFVWKTDDIKMLYGYWETLPIGADLLKMNTLIPLASPKETATRLSNLLIFS